MIEKTTGNKWCTFCDEFEGKDSSNFRRLFSPTELSSRILYRSEHFVSIPGLGSLGLAYLLILPRDHFISMADIPSEWKNELSDFKERLRTVIADRYTTPIMFEHGPAVQSNSSTGCCVEHAHIHIVATTVELLDELKAYFKNEAQGIPTELLPKQIINDKPIRDLLKKRISYLWYESHDQQEWLFPLTKSIESQFIRKLLARHLNIPDPEWDWELFPRKESVIKNFHEIKAALEKQESDNLIPAK